MSRSLPTSHGSRGGLVLRDGIHLAVRPIRPQDRDALAAMVARMSAESRRLRFLAPKGELSSRELAHLTDVDHVSHEALVAIDPAGGGIVAVSRYASYPSDPSRADVAFEVLDEWHGRGIGAALTARVVEHARRHGIRTLTATTLWENRPARALLKRLGFRGTGSAGADVELELDLEPAAQEVSTALAIAATTITAESA